MVAFCKLAIKAGKPFAKLAKGVFFGLPGDPLSVMVSVYQLAVPAVELMGGFKVRPAMRFNAIGNAKLKTQRAHGFSACNLCCR